MQGVGFRAFVADEAETRRLIGWVRNRADHSVEAVISGDSDIVEEMIEACRRGPRGSRVENIAVEEVSEGDLTGRAGFEILRTV